VGIAVDLAALPVAAGVPEVARALGRDPVVMAATGGEDYELLFCAPPERWGALEEAGRGAGAPVTRLGVADGGAGLRLVGPDGRAVEGLRGYEHG
jgi:thiamine-monophosphate kinase